MARVVTTPAAPETISPSCAPVAPIFLRYRDNLLKYIHSKVSDPVSREDLLSDVMIKLYDQCDRLETVNNVEGWLIGIARNTVMDYFRSRQKEPSTFDPPENISMNDEISESVDITSCVHAMIELLPEKYRGPLRAYELEGVPQKDLAMTYGISHSGVKSRVQRGRVLLRDLFTRYCAEAMREECGDGLCGADQCREAGSD